MKWARVKLFAEDLLIFEGRYPVVHWRFYDHLPIDGECDNYAQELFSLLRQLIGLAWLLLVIRSRFQCSLERVDQQSLALRELLKWRSLSAGSRFRTVLVLPPPQFAILISDLIQACIRDLLTVLWTFELPQSELNCSTEFLNKRRTVILLYDSTLTSLLFRVIWNLPLIFT